MSYISLEKVFNVCQLFQTLARDGTTVANEERGGFGFGFEFRFGFGFGSGFGFGGGRIKEEKNKRQ
jgi:hypothetical protein